MPKKAVRRWVVVATSRRGALREPEGVDAATQRLLTTNEGTMAETYLEDMRRRRTAKFQAERDPEMGAQESARLRRPVLLADLRAAEAAALAQRVLRFAMGRVGQMPIRRVKSAELEFNRVAGARIREVRTARGMTQVELAEGLGITKGMLVRYEYGRVSMSAFRIESIAGALNVNVRTLMPRFLNRHCEEGSATESRKGC